jgi:hypothetical protein
MSQKIGIIAAKEKTTQSLTSFLPEFVVFIYKTALEKPHET